MTRKCFGGEGDDFIVGGEGVDLLMGNEGDDWMEGGGGFDTTAGDNLGAVLQQQAHQGP